jgi:GT2 family glycosyltransferase
MDISVIIVSWNTKALLDQCLRSIYETVSVEDLKAIEIYVVDNASSDGSPEMVEELYPSVRLVSNTENIGFARANNQVIREVESRYILMLNPDTILLPGAIRSLVRFMDSHPEAGAAGPRLLNPDHSLQTSCYPVPTISREFWRLFHLDRVHRYGTYDMSSWGEQTVQEVGVIQGACLLLRRSALNQVGYLDEDYFIYTEEVDLCYRLRCAGWKLWWIPEAEVIHYGEQSTKQLAPEMFLRLYESKIIFFRKHYGQLSLGTYKFILTGAALARLAAIPFALIESPAARKKHIDLAKNYRNLIWHIPSM